MRTQDVFRGPAGTHPHLAEPQNEGQGGHPIADRGAWFWSSASSDALDGLPGADRWGVIEAKLDNSFKKHEL